ncbi:phosphatidylserine decarboxylase [Rhodocollybia butyracea]|uniref:Phosphatidylserine decarboxylase n=1 Tax=Rhodocollybia butyracea TaxID=206335 RepID=A0A9P5P2D7_9AGAR|nr:phosphatidylserine decarboxylase [Rhodocollybia butyracea]
MCTTSTAIMSQQLPKTRLTRYGGWLPASRTVHHSFIKHHIHQGRNRHEAGATHTAPVAKFKAAINADSEMVDLWTQVFLQASTKDEVKTFDHFLHMMDGIIFAAPKFHMAKDENGNIIGEPIGVPMLLLFDLLSNTGAAYDLFRRSAFNAALKDLLDAWGQYLQTPDSGKTLTDGEEGWFTSFSLQNLENGRGTFNETYVCPDASLVNRGYTSWDEFFTRKIQLHARPVLFAENKGLIHSACESTVYRIQTNVKYHDQFWLKGQVYSLYDMFNRDEHAKSFEGGTVYQAFLSPQDYHRWHCPVNGTIVRAHVVPGTYYAVIPDSGAPAGDPDLRAGDPHGALIRSQTWLSHSSARAIIYIEADNEDIGLMAFIGVGMAEVSTCEILVKEGQRVSTGDEMGMYHFGGSSHALVFGPQTKITFADGVKLDEHLLVNSVLAQASRV